MEPSENLLCLFNAEVEKRGASYVIEVPQREVEIGSIEPGEVHSVAIISSETQETPSASTDSIPERSRTDGPPVEEDEVLDVEIEDVGDKGDGIARVGPGFIVFVPGTHRGERVTVEITEVRENLAFAEVV